MPKLPVIRASKLLRTLLKMGFYEHHRTGSHIQLKHPDGRRTTLPYHPTQEIRKGTLKAILDDLEITTEEFIKILKKQK
jgi:predicted RNA binding protein YcfA (HicA-like mRNA interferase family)